jgi:predicted ferric reductase
LGPAFLLGGIHALLIGRDISNFLPLKIWIGFFITIGVFSSAYSFFYRRLGSKFFYKIAGIERAVDVITIHLQPQGARIMLYNPGQFVYVEFKNKKIGSELHPFSIVSSPQEENLQISAKIVGDYSLKLFHYLREGEAGVVYGPYGQFANNLAALGNSLWIAGGIGVTPFLSMLSAEARNHSDRSIYFYYVHSQKEEGVFLGQIYNFLTKAPHVTFFDWCTKEKNRLNVNVIRDYLDIRTLDAIFLCGPLSMMEGFKKQFLDIGVPEKKIFYENFSLI